MNREIRTDLAIELRENVADRRNMPGVKVKTVVNEDRSIKTTTITVLDEIGEKNLGKAKGQYITIECSKLKEYEESIHEPLRAELEGRLRELMGHAGNILVVGLGNRQVTPDSIGPLVIDNLYVTRHLDTPGKPDLVMSAICPGVMAQTGIETVDIVRGICDEIDVEIVVAIDALAARSSKRLGCTIQLTDTGISPGSGVGNKIASVGVLALHVEFGAVEGESRIVRKRCAACRAVISASDYRHGGVRKQIAALYRAREQHI